MKQIKQHLQTRIFLSVFYLLGFFLASPANAVQKDISSSPSPYVSMHAEDMVRWSAWNSQVLKRAKRENKLVFLTIGYFSCYWCHVLQRESFNNKSIADNLNKNFISVVVDREIHSALDSHMTAFAEKTLGRSGWPLNIVLTPDGYPLMAAIYYPPDKFNAWLNKVLSLWQTDPTYIRSIAKDAAYELEKIIKPKKHNITAELSHKVLKQFIREVKASRDEFNGGFGEQSKFPLPVILEAVLASYNLTQDKELSDFLALTLEQIRRKGLRDHLQEGFFRYTTGPDWYVPHFEKMLYDNAQLARLFLVAGKAFDNQRWIKTGETVLEFIGNNLRSEHGGYYSSFSAVDDNGVEGGYYLWEKDQWQKLLTQSEQSAVTNVWAWDKPPLLDDGYYPLYMNELSSKVEEKHLRSAIKSLFEQRKKRRLPVDKKVLTAWNALLLEAFLDAFEITGKPSFKRHANDLSAFFVKQYSGNKRPKGFFQNKSIGDASLEDYAYLSHALLRHSRLLKSKASHDLAVLLLNEAWSRYFSEYGWRLSDALLIPVISSETLVADGPLPSASAKIIAASLMTDDASLISQARLALRYGHERLSTQAFWYASHVLLLQDKKIYANE